MIPMTRSAQTEISAMLQKRIDDQPTISREMVRGRRTFFSVI